MYAVLSCSIVSDSATPWTVARQAPLSMGFSRQGYWSGLPFPYPGDLPYPGIKPRSPALQADALLSEPAGNQINVETFFFLRQAESDSSIKLLQRKPVY